MKIKPFSTHHLVKSEDLNHHGTLFAGRSAEWFVEAGFIAAAALARPENIVCLRIHGMTFTQPVHPGEIVCFESKIVFTGRTRLVAYIGVNSHEKQIVDGFITFIHVDMEGRPTPHHIEIIPETSEDFALNERAQALFSQ